MYRKIILFLLTVAAHLTIFSVHSLSSDLPQVINDDAGWCWFQDERVIFHDNRLIAGSVAAGTHDPSRKGNIEVVSLDLESGETDLFVLHANLELDDHDLPAFLALPDGRILAVYSKHNKDLSVRYRITTAPGDITDWTPERTYEFDIFSGNVTYSNLFRLEAESGSIYNFHRGKDFDPNLLLSDDNGENWRYAGRLVGGPGRPYVRYASNNTDTIHFVCTDQHPRDFDNNLYHGFVRSGRIHDSFGNEVGHLGKNPAEHTKLTRIFQGDPDNVAWASDLEYSDDGRIYTVYSVQKDGAGMPPGFGGMDHRYRYAYFDGVKWNDSKVAYAGTKIYGGEDDYTGLICLHPEQLNTVYFSTNADPVTGKPLISSADGNRHYEIFKGVTEDGGETWVFTSVTKNSAEDQIRPLVPKGGPPGSALLWLRGKMKTYTNYDLEMVVLRPAP